MIFSLCIFKKYIWILFDLCQITHHKLQISSLSLYICNYTRQSWTGHLPSYMLLGINISYRVICKRKSFIGKRICINITGKQQSCLLRTCNHYRGSQPPPYSKSSLGKLLLFHLKRTKPSNTAFCLPVHL